MSADQAAELRKLAAELGRADPDGRSARVLAITSGKGGVGKTNVAVNLAARLATMSRRVLLLDADMGLANADVLCNTTAQSNLAHVVAGRRRIEDVLLEGPGGFTLIPGASGLARMADLSEFERAQVLTSLGPIEADHDLILIDTGAGIGAGVLSYLLAADEMLVVTTPEPTAVTDAYALIKAVSRRKDAPCISLLVNFARDRREGRRVYERINAVCRRFLGVCLLDAGHIVQDSRVPAAVRARRPFVLAEPDCQASACITRLAHKVDRHAKENHQVGFFRRVTGWLAG